MKLGREYPISNNFFQANFLQMLICVFPGLHPRRSTSLENLSSQRNTINSPPMSH